MPKERDLNYDIAANDPRLALLADLERIHQVEGYNGPKSLRLSLAQKAGKEKA